LREPVAVDEDDVEDPKQARKRRLIKWGKKVAARGVLLGVNYIQGWLAWQGIKRAALERERNLPKFPVF
jgi:hypothetical protein